MSIKRINAACSLTLILFCTSLAEDLPPTRAIPTDRVELKQLEDFILHLPTEDSMFEDSMLLETRGNGGAIDPRRGMKPPTPEELKWAAQHLKKAKEDYDRLRTLIHIGASIFDYPGLISRCRPHYSEYSSYGAPYSLHLGVHLRGDYRVIFDAHGTITDISNVIYGGP